MDLTLVAALLLADVITPPTETLAGGAGWVGAGLLGAVLAWLLFVHLPAQAKLLKEHIEAKDAQIIAKDKQLKEMLEAKDAQIQSLVANCDKELQAVVTAATVQMRETRADFKDALGSILAHGEKQTAQLSVAIQAEFGRLTTALLEGSGPRRPGK